MPSASSSNSTRLPANGFSPGEIYRATRSPGASTARARTGGDGSWSGLTRAGRIESALEISPVQGLVRLIAKVADAAGGSVKPLLPLFIVLRPGCVRAEEAVQRLILGQNGQ